VSHAAALVDEIANELDTWPGVHIEGLSENSALVRYQELELGVLDRDLGEGSPVTWGEHVTDEEYRATPSS
jgi:hypothetical protein